MCLVVIDGPKSALIGARVSADTGVGLVLHSLPGAAAYLGAPVFFKIIEAAQRQYPNARLDGCLDCGDAPGLALNALRQGARFIRFNGPAAERIEEMAERLRAHLVVGPFPNHAPDLSRMKNAEASLRRLLSQA